MTLLLNPAAWIGGAAAASVALLWALMFHGPDQREIGATKALIKADRITKEVANDLTNQAEAARLAYDLCIGTGGVYEFDGGECER